MISGLQIGTLVLIAVLGHIMALVWYVAAKGSWTICSTTIYDLPFKDGQIRQELINSWHTPIHAVILAAFAWFGFFTNDTMFSFIGSALLAIVWAEIWHYWSHRAFHTRWLHWIHVEHHKSHLNTPFTAISFSFSEKLIFDVGFLGFLAIIDFVWTLNFYGIAMWYVVYLVINSFSHANFEMKSKTYNRYLGQIFTSTTYHSLHHSRYTGNYGLGTRFLDRLFGTEWEDYERLYARVVDNRPLTKLRQRADEA